MSSIAAGLEAVHGGNADTPVGVFARCDGFEMCWVHTAADPAQMVYLQPFWNLSHEVFIRGARDSTGAIVDFD